VIEDIARNAIPLTDRYPNSKEGREFSLNILGSGIGFGEGTKSSHLINKPKTINDALEVMRFVSSRFRDPLVIVIDELERIESPDEREKFGELIKNVPELGDKVRFIFCGISNDINELLSSHPSAGRILETIKLDRLNHNHLWEIILGVANKLGVTVDKETLIRISQISDGFPHFVHLIGESMFWNMWDDDSAVSQTRPCDFKAGVLGALSRTEEVHRAAYDRATMKTKNTQQYEMALWALADRTSDKRQLSEIYESSLKRLQYNQPADFPFMTREILNQRLLALKKESHARISVGFGSGWFGVREKIMRGYIRLRAEQEGVQLGLDQSSS